MSAIRDAQLLCGIELSLQRWAPCNTHGVRRVLPRAHWCNAGVPSVRAVITPLTHAVQPAPHRGRAPDPHRSRCPRPAAPPRVQRGGPGSKYGAHPTITQTSYIRPTPYIDCTAGRAFSIDLTPHPPAAPPVRRATFNPPTACVLSPPRSHKTRVAIQLVSPFRVARGILITLRTGVRRTRLGGVSTQVVTHLRPLPKKPASNQRYTSELCAIV